MREHENSYVGQNHRVIYGQEKEGVVDPVLVVLASVDRRRENLFRSAKAAKDGSFQLSDIAPGDYDIYALSRNGEDQFMEDLYLRQFSSQATRLTIAPKDARRQDLGLIDVTPRGFKGVIARYSTITPGKRSVVWRLSRATSTVFCQWRARFAG